MENNTLSTSSLNDEGEFLYHTACDQCGSSDARAIYSTGTSFCFVCSTYGRDREAAPAKTSKASRELLSGSFVTLASRGLSEETCRKWGYQISQYKGEPVQVANYRSPDGELVAQKVRTKDKDFKVLGDIKKAGLYGQHLWRDGGKMLVITEGEIDALSVSQAQGNKWPVVSVPNGAQGAKKSLAKQVDWLEKFETIVFCFDMDEPGQEAAKECALLLSPGKAKIAHLPLKDANEMLVAGRSKDLISALWEAKVYRPDGIVSGEELWEIVSKEDDQPSIPYPWDGLTKVTHGLRRGELITFTAGSGIGKSQVCREVAYHLSQLGETLGYIALEESVRRSALGLMGLHLNKPLHLDRTGVSDSDFASAFRATVGNGRTYLYDHFGSLDLNNLLSRVRYLARGCGCSWIFLDHLSIVVSGISDGDERRLIDNAMTALRSLVEELGIGLILVSHLKRPEGRGHEEGAKTSLAQLRGSAAIAQLSDMVIGLERDQQDPEAAHLTTVRVLKNRFSGETGEACHLAYNPVTGRLTEYDGHTRETSAGDCDDF